MARRRTRAGGEGSSHAARWHTLAQDPLEVRQSGRDGPGDVLKGPEPVGADVAHVAFQVGARVDESDRGAVGVVGAGWAGECRHGDLTVAGPGAPPCPARPPATPPGGPDRSTAGRRSAAVRTRSRTRPATSPKRSASSCRRSSSSAGHPATTATNQAGGADSPRSRSLCSAGSFVVAALLL